MIQVDALSDTIPGFIQKAARAGCSSVFIGVESLNSRNLRDVGKDQNNVMKYGKLIDAWRSAGVATQVGYIIGLPHDTEESVKSDIDRLMSDVRPDRASFFMMTPLPGSEDHRRMTMSGAELASDYNLFDSCHETMLHPLLKGGAWTQAYRTAWERFYSFENMRAILSRTTPENYWDTFRGLFWYKHSACCEGMHPMLSGLLRLKDRRTRRCGWPIESALQHLRRRVPNWRSLFQEAFVWFWKWKNSGCKRVNVVKRNNMCWQNCRRWGRNCGVESEFLISARPIWQ